MSSGNLYKTTAGGTAGATAPTHTSGSVSDGGVTWDYVSSIANGPRIYLSLHGVPVYSAADSTQQVYRAVYVLYNRVIIVDSFGASKDATLTSFKTLLTAQVQKSPPTERTNN